LFPERGEYFTSLQFIPIYREGLGTISFMSANLSGQLKTSVKAGHKSSTNRTKIRPGYPINESTKQPFFHATDV